MVFLGTLLIYYPHPSQCNAYAAGVYFQEHGILGEHYPY